MMTGTAIVTLVAMSGWLMLNWRALQSHGLTFERKAAYAVAWAVVFALTAFVFARLAG